MAHGAINNKQTTHTQKPTVWIHVLVCIDLVSNSWKWPTGGFTSINPFMHYCTCSVGHTPYTCVFLD